MEEMEVVRVDEGPDLLIVEVSLHSRHYIVKLTLSEILNVLYPFEEGGELNAAESSV